MESNQNDYHVSFFKPVTRRARRNRNMVIWLVLIWAIAVFGFQFLLRAIEKPVPEPAYESFVSVWDDVQSREASKEDVKIFAGSVLTVLGKIYVKPEYYDALSAAFSHAVYQISDGNREMLEKRLAEFSIMRAESENIADHEYIISRKELENEVATLLDLPANDARMSVIPFVLDHESFGKPIEIDNGIIEEAMSVYLIHNRSVLTDIKFLGFPFHYFYTAVFLLVVFIGLCWIYCILTDRRELKAQANFQSQQQSS